MKKNRDFTVDVLVDELLGFIRSTILVDNADITLDTPLEKIGIDSVSLLEILLYLERQFEVYIADEDLTPENISSVRKLAATAYATVSGP